jgi:hypothetical protein
MTAGRLRRARAIDGNQSREQRPEGEDAPAVVVMPQLHSWRDVT